jgi:DNA-binding CsgD family transcriptional regulator
MRKEKSKTSCLRVIFTFFIFHSSFFTCFGQVASRTDGVNVFYYDSLHDAISAAEGTSIGQPDEITLLEDVVLDEPLLLDDNVHIRLVAGGLGSSESPSRTIRRSAGNIAYPVIWIRGEDASLSLGKPGMEHELIIDGGYLNSPPIEARAPLVALNGPGSKLIMYDKAVLQNNCNIGDAVSTSLYQNGAGVIIFTQGHVTDRQAEFVMKGGIIRGNINNTQNPIPCGGGVLIHNYGIFTMEGGVIMNNTAMFTGGGFYSGRLASLKKTGGIIHGSNAPAAYRNTVMTGLGTPRCYGHALGIGSNLEYFLGFRNDTVAENDNLSYTGGTLGDGIFGIGEKWDTPDKAFRRMLLAVILPVLALAVCAFLIFWKITLKKRLKTTRTEYTAPGIDLENFGLSDREKEICKLLLTERTMKEIALILELSYSGANFHAQKLYAKLGVQNRTELLVRMNNDQRTKNREQ